MKEKNVWFRWIAWVLFFAMCMNSTGIITLAADVTEAETSTMQEDPMPDEKDKPPQEATTKEALPQEAPQERITESSQGFDIEFYVYLNGEKFLVRRNGIPKIVTWKEKRTTYHGIAVDDLVDIYKEFGFVNDQSPIEKFVSAYRGKKGIEYGQVYTDPATGKKYVSYNDGEGKQGEAVDVYYLPKGKGVYLTLEPAVRRWNNFYQVTVRDETKDPKETIYYALNGTKKDILLSNIDEKNPGVPIPWTCFGVNDDAQDDPIEGTVQGKNTKFTITDIGQSYRIRRADFDKESSGFDIQFHVYVDNEIRTLPSDFLKKVYKWSDRGESYVAISDLAEIYKEYGLDANAMQFGACFPYTVRGEKELAHGAMKTIGGKQYVSYTLPDQDVTVPTDVYYMPKRADKKEKVPVDIVDSNGTITSSVADQLKNNKHSFYSVTVIEEDGTRTVTYYKQGDNATVSVRKGNTDKNDWLASNESGDKTIPPVEKDADTLEFIFQKMDQPYTIACKRYSPTKLNVKIYTFVDYQRNLITGINEEIPVIRDTTSKPGTTYYYISNDELKKRLQKFHYNGSLRDATGKRERFYYSKRDLDTLHNAGVTPVNGQECIYVGKTGEPMDLYYLPGGETLPILNANTLMNYTDDRYNGFYSVTVLDEKGQVYDPSQLESLPKIDYVARKATGEDALTRTVSMKPRGESQTEDVSWECRLKEDGTSSGIIPVLDQENRTMSFTIQGNDAVRPYVIVPANTEKPKEEIESNVSFHVFIDGDHRLVKNINTTLYYISKEHSGMTSRYYLRARADDTISQVYKEYGFKPEDLESETGGKGKLLFGHGTDTRVFVQYPYKDKDGTWYIPVLKNGHDVSVYYLANACTLNPNKIENYFDRNTGLSAQIGSAGVKFNRLSSVHLMEVIDPLNLTEGKAVGRKYVPNGSHLRIEVQKKASLKGEYEGKDIVWSLTAANKDAPIVAPTEGASQDTWVYTWSNITSSYTLAADRPQSQGTVRVIYDTTRYMKKLPKEAKLTPQVGNKTRYTEDVLLEEAADYIIKSPYPLTYDHEDNDSKKLEQYEFDHWDYKDAKGRWQEAYDGKKLGDIVKNSEKPIVFYAAWKKVSDRNRKQVQFYICKSAMPEDSSVALPSTDTNDFTGAVAVANCNVRADRIKDGQVLGDEGAKTWEQYEKGHQEILKLLQGTKGHKGGAGFAEDMIFKLDRIPSDEEVFQTIRESGRKIRIEQREIPSDQLDTEFFTIYWYSFKNELRDGWHLDGRIVAKNGHVVVTKDFVGQPDVIEEIQKNYSIAIDMNEKTQNGAVQPPAFHQHMDLVLPQKEGEQPKEPQPGRIQIIGEWTNKEHTSCRWIVKADSFWEYTLKEQNYQSTDPLVQCSSWYNVHHSHNEAENVNTWEHYPETGVFFTGRGVGRGGESLTIELENRYQKNNVLTINKFDATTGHGMERIEFAVSVNGVEKDPLITDQNGIAEMPIQLQDSSGNNRTATETYLLREKNVPTGYIDAGDVQMTVAIADGTFKITEAKLVDRIDEGVNAPLDGKIDGKQVLTVRGDTSLNIRNFSQMSALSVQKTWENRMDALTEQQVKIRLLRNGQTTGKDFILNEENNWQHTIEKVPLFIDQEPVEYTIQEIEIGKTHYSPEFGDGFMYYEVIYPEVIYQDGGGKKWTPTNPEEFAKIRKMDLEVQNMHFNLAERSFLKTDDLPRKRLEGAKFQLYEVPYKEGTTDYVDDQDYTVVEENGSIVLKKNGETCIKDPNLSFTTDDKGMIFLPPVRGETGVKNGRYWMIESSTPNKGNQNFTQYEDNLSLYMVEVQDEILFLYEREDQKTTFKGLSDRHVVNHPLAGGITVEIRKEVTGPFGHMDKPFDIEVYYQEEGMQMYKTAKASLKNGEILKVEHVNIGSTIKITEAIGDANYSVALLREKGSEQPELLQTATVENGKAVMTCKVEGMPKTTQKWILRNENTEDATPDTGIHLEKNLYLWILAIAAATSVLLFFRRRRNRHNIER